VTAANTRGMMSQIEGKGHVVTSTGRPEGTLYINGQWVRADGDQSEPVINPATEQVLATVPVGTDADCSAAIASAREAFDHGPWPAMSGAERADHMTSFWEALDKRHDEIVDLVIAETGAPRPLAEGLHFQTSMDHLKFFAEAARWDPVESLPIDVTSKPSGGQLLGGGVQVHEPFGVVTAITPFNFPFFIDVAKIGPAMATGNTVVLKPSPFTPLEAFVLAEAAAEAGIPAGVLNVITGGPEVGRRLTTDPRVDMITFTGSDGVGAAVSQQASTTLKKVLLELGGKSALIVRADGDLEAAAQFAVGQYTLQAGQGCSLCTRHLVDNSVKAEFLDLMEAFTKGLRLGDPAEAATTMGPLIRESQRARVSGYVEAARQQGARVVTGGQRPKGLDRGFFYEPTIVTDVDHGWPVAQEEIFGPVAVVHGFATDDEAVALANDSEFGLAGAIFSADSGTAYQMALRIRTGGVAINGGSGRMNSWAPFGGTKRSGIGREYGIEGVREYTQTKVITFNAG
jgi:aldehyde dehydrogenase (NAD+)